jgi:hypothetical protein
VVLLTLRPSSPFWRSNARSLRIPSLTFIVVPVRLLSNGVGKVVVVKVFKFKGIKCKGAGFGLVKVGLVEFELPAVAGHLNA